MSQKKENNIKVGDIVSVPLGSQYLKGQVKSIDEKNIVINNYKDGDITIPNNKLVYKFFPGQKFDFRELNIEDSVTQKTLIQRLDILLKKTSIGGYNQMIKNPEAKKDILIPLLKGEMTKLVNGQTLIENKDTNSKELKEWSAKISMYQAINSDGSKALKLDLKYPKEQLSKTVYGQEISEEDRAKMVEQKQSIVITAKNQRNIEFKAFVKYDKELNQYVTFPYSEKVEQRMKQAYAKYEAKQKENSVTVNKKETVTKSTTNESSTSVKQTTKETKKTEVTKNNKKGRGISA